MASATARCAGPTFFPLIFSVPDSNPQPPGELGGEPHAGACIQMPPDLQLFFSGAASHAPRPPVQPYPRAVAPLLLQQHLRATRVELVPLSALGLRHFYREPPFG